MGLLRIGLFASGGGTNLQAIIDACARGDINAIPAVVIGNNSKARSLERARQAGIDTVHLSSVTHPNPEALDNAILDTLKTHEVDLIALAGYTRHLGPRVIDAYRDRIVNVHPALLPKHGGSGMYGPAVHESVLASGDAESGVSIHLVNEIYDEGRVLAQARVPVLEGDTAQTLAARVLEQEHILYVATLRRIAAGELSLDAPTDHS